MPKFHTHDADFLPMHAFRSRDGKSGPMTLEGGKGSAPQADPRMGEAANRQIALAEKQYADYNAAGGDKEWMRQTAADALAISKKTGESAQALSEYQLGAMKTNDERYRNVAVPFEDKILKDVERFDSQAYKDGQVASAMADVESATTKVADQAQRSQMRMGISPDSGRAAAMSAQLGMGKASAMAFAANSTRRASDQVGLASKMQMYGGMKGLAGLGNANAGLAQGAMGTGLAAGAAGQNAVGGSLSANNANYGSVNSGLGAGISGLGQVASLNQNAAQINNANDPFASILGAGAQLGAAYLGKPSDRRLKQNILLVGKDERTGLNLYQFRYINGDDTTYVGVMADEVQLDYPDAVVTRPDGFLAVKYDELGLEMTTLADASH